MIVAGVDLCHIGPKFGHADHAAILEEKAVAHDQKLLDAVISGDINAFCAEMKFSEDRLNVCGFSSLATLLEIAGPVHGKVLDYEIWHEKETNSAVSFAAAVLWRN